MVLATCPALAIDFNAMLRALHLLGAPLTSSDAFDAYMLGPSPQGGMLLAIDGISEHNVLHIEQDDQACRTLRRMT